MNKLKFGTAGIPISAQKRTSQAGIERLVELDLDCMELEFVRGVQMKTATAQEIKQVASENSIELTVHGPYYINLNSRDADKIVASKERILKAARIGWQAGAKSVTFHAAYYHEDDPDLVYERVRDGLHDVRKTLNEEGVVIDLSPETTGSPKQFGTVAEIVRLSTEIPGVYPCIDFSHLHARSQGGYTTYEHFASELELVKRELGSAALHNLHMHLSGIDYGDKGEKKHLSLPESDMNYQAVLQALIDFNVGGWLICESPNLEEDAQLLKQTYHQLLARQNLS